MKKILYFEGAGWDGAEDSKATDMKNCRIRTAFKNDKGNRIYLEMSCVKAGGRFQKAYNHLKYAGHISDCFYITDNSDDCNINQIQQGEGLFEYNKINILNFVNSLGCHFDDVETLPDLAGYRVHAGTRYNYGDEFIYNKELTERAIAIHKFFYSMERIEKKRNPNFSLWIDEGNPELLHLLRHFEGYNKHWTISNTENWEYTIQETTLGRYGC